jgi:predicted component of type VI protein secretion system
MELTWEVQLILQAPEVPKTQLGIAGQLGWTTWLISKPVTEDVRDCVLNPVAA